MGIYINPPYSGFEESLNTQIYVDKTSLIAQINKAVETRNKYICVSRPRRFGKTMTADMLIAYYCNAYDSSKLFEGLDIASDESFRKNLNKYTVLFLNIQNFLSSDKLLTENIEKNVLKEVRDICGEIVDDSLSLADNLEVIYQNTGQKFVVIVDEWDSIFRTQKEDFEFQKQYLDFLRRMFKDRNYIALVYMTGILPIKKYGNQSALNMFDEYSMTDEAGLKLNTGFTEEEVENLCQKYGVDGDMMHLWYDGYIIGGEHIYNPKSVTDAIRRGRFGNYWTKTETYEALSIYFDINMEGLRDDITQMLSGAHIEADISTFKNDMTSLDNKYDVLTLLIHLGYLSYDEEKKQIFIPNEEIRSEFVTAVKVSKWQEVSEAVKASEKLLEDTISCNTSAVAEGISRVHSENVSILSYNNENSLACVIALAYYSARRHYTIVREMPAGKGFADLVFIPRQTSNKPAMIVELKWDKTAQNAISQIKEKNYTDVLKNYRGDILLVGINYDTKTKKHSCAIEKIYMA